MRRDLEKAAKLFGTVSFKIVNVLKQVGCGRLWWQWTVLVSSGLCSRSSSSSVSWQRTPFEFGSSTDMFSELSVVWAFLCFLGRASGLFRVVSWFPLFCLELCFIALLASLTLDHIIPFVPTIAVIHNRKRVLYKLLSCMPACVCRLSKGKAPSSGCPSFLTLSVFDLDIHFYHYPQMAHFSQVSVYSSFHQSRLHYSLLYISRGIS